jgi:hypothetical protein
MSDWSDDEPAATKQVFKQIFLNKPSVGYHNFWERTSTGISGGGRPSGDYSDKNFKGTVSRDGGRDEPMEQ